MSDNRNIFEVIVGVAVIAFSVGFGALLYKNMGASNMGNYYTVKASFEKADGVSVGSEVNVSGVKIGEVLSKNLDQNNYNAIVHLKIIKDITLPVDTSAEIVSASLLGDKYVSLVPGAESEMLKDGDSIEFTQSSVSIEGLITKFVFGMDNNKGEEKSEDAEEKPEEKSVTKGPGEEEQKNTEPNVTSEIKSDARASSSDVVFSY